MFIHPWIDQIIVISCKGILDLYTSFWHTSALGKDEEKKNLAFFQLDQDFWAPKNVVLADPKGWNYIVASLW